MTVIQLSRVEAAKELLARRQARQALIKYIEYTSGDKYHRSFFSDEVCKVLDQFIEDVQAGKRPILIFQAPPQHGKSEIVSRKLPAYLLGRFPNWRVGACSYNRELASDMGQAVRRNLSSPEHVALFPSTEMRKYSVDRVGEFSVPGGEGSYIGVGVGSGLTGRPLDIGIIDDPIKNHEEALSDTTKASNWNWYQTVFKTRLSKNSGEIIMATSWAEDDLPGRIISEMNGNPRLKVLRFPAINEPDEVGYNPDLPLGALVPELHPIDQLQELKAGMSDYWWSAMYQQNPRSLGGNVFKEKGIQYYLPKDLPQKFDQVIASWDCTFKDTDGTDFVVGQAWGKKGTDSYLLGQVRARMSFTKTCSAVEFLKDKIATIRGILIEDKANGPAVIDTLKKKVPGILPVEPDGSKLARAHAVTAYWEAGNIWLPHPDIADELFWDADGRPVRGGVKLLVTELTTFPASANDDQVDALSQALRHLYPVFEAIKISKEVLQRAAEKARRR